MPFWKPIKQISMHPTDYIWALMGNEPDVAHQMVLDWMAWRADRMEQEANAELRRMAQEPDSLLNQNKAVYLNELYGVGPNYHRRVLPRYGT